MEQQPFSDFTPYWGIKCISPPVQGWGRPGLNRRGSNTCLSLAPPPRPKKNFLGSDTVSPLADPVRQGHLKDHEEYIDTFDNFDDVVDFDDFFMGLLEANHS